MQRHFDEELKKLKEKLFKMGLLVEEAVRKAVTALINRDTKLAEQVIDQDQKVNIIEIEIDEYGHELIALRQPTAVDLRLITMVLKINSDLERIGDQAVNIAEKAIAISKEAPVKCPANIQKMADVALAMAKDALDAFVKGDPLLAKRICERDDEIDTLNDQAYRELQDIMKKEPQNVPQELSLIMVAHNLERIGDLATNIAEDTIYVTKGIDIRHHITERRDT